MRNWTNSGFFCDPCVPPLLTEEVWRKFCHNWSRKHPFRCNQLQVEKPSLQTSSKSRTTLITDALLVKCFLEAWSGPGLSRPRRMYMFAVGCWDCRDRCRIAHQRSHQGEHSHQPAHHNTVRRTFFWGKYISRPVWITLRYSKFNRSQFGCHPAQSTEWLAGTRVNYDTCPQAPLNFVVLLWQEDHLM